MVCDVEQVHRPRQVEVAVRIEGADELVRVGLQIRFHLEVDAETAVRVAIRCALAPEALRPLAGRAVGNHAELAGLPHAEHRRFFGA